MALLGVLENLEDLQARQSDLEACLTKFFSLLHDATLTGMMRAYYDNVAEQFQPKAIRLTMIKGKWTLILLAGIGLSLASGCVYRANISQGNLIKTENLDQVEIGMTKNQIRFLLGTPMIDDPFSKNRWDYVYFVKIGRKDADRKRWISIYFTEEVVSDVHKDQELAPAL